MLLGLDNSQTAFLYLRHQKRELIKILIAVCPRFVMVCKLLFHIRREHDTVLPCCHWPLPSIVERYLRRGVPGRAHLTESD